MANNNNNNSLENSKKELIESECDGGIFNKLDKLTADTNLKAPSIKEFAIIKPISRGAFGKVFLGYKITDANKLFAIKVMRKSEMINKNMVSQVITERNALALSRSPFCVHLFYSLQTVSYIYLVMEYMVGGDLKSLLTVSGFFDETAAKFYCAEIALALRYLHEHGIVHRDIKPDNMLVAASGHVKLTDFGLSKIEFSRDLELSDLINCSPNLNNARTPGQLLSLTSHLSFGSGEKLMKSNRYTEGGGGGYMGGGGTQPISKLMQALNQTPNHELDNSSHQPNDSHMSGISPFLSTEDNQVNLNAIQQKTKESLSSYYSCNSSIGSKMSSGESTKNNSNTKFGANKLNKENDTINEGDEDGCLISSSMKVPFRNASMSKENEDSGVGSRKSELSTNNLNCELSAIEKANNSVFSKDDCNSLDFSKSYNNSNENESSNYRNDSPVKNIKFLNHSRRYNMKPRRNFMNEDPVDDESLDREVEYSKSTGLTQEINILDIGSSTPTRMKRKATSPVQGVLKVRSLSSDDEPVNEHLNIDNVMVSTPVSSTKPSRGLLKLKSTRFVLPSSSSNKTRMKNSSMDCMPSRFIKMGDEPAMSPINSGHNQMTPKATQTPFRTPKSVRRAGKNTSERILGTPDYLAPELLLSHTHGFAVDWWALGVCLYEFMTGVPPFNDETPQKVFDNILNRNIEWPQDEEALSDSAVEAVEQLLTMEPTKRPAAKDVQEMNFFQTIAWDNLQSMEPPFVPNPDCPTDTGYFEARNIMQHLKLSNFNAED